MQQRRVGIVLLPGNEIEEAEKKEVESGQRKNASPSRAAVNK
jgi:hypothetical protein